MDEIEKFAYCKIENDILKKTSFELFVSQNYLHYLERRRHDVFGQSSKMVTNSSKRVSCSLKSLKRTIIS